jgi:hypothetical protein
VRGEKCIYKEFHPQSIPENAVRNVSNFYKQENKLFICGIIDIRLGDHHPIKQNIEQEAN